jgi:2-methylcitrate dehydratase
VAADPRIDRLREKIVCVEEPSFTAAYHDPDRRAIPNALRVEFTDGSSLDEVVVEYPIGHERRRAEGAPLLVEKFTRHLHRLSADARARILAASFDAAKLDGMPVCDYVDLFV